MGRLGSVAAGVLAAVVSLAAGDASGQAPEDDGLGRARALYREGVEQFDAGDLDAALRSFRESYRLHPHPETLYSTAGVLSRLGRYREAIGVYEEYLSGERPIPRTRRELVTGEVERLRGMLARLSLLVEPAGATVSIDGVVVGAAPLGEPVEVDPGPHAIQASLEGYREGSAQASPAPGAWEEVSITLGALPAFLIVVDAPPNASIELDGTVVGSHPLESAVEVLPGMHVVRATSEGYEPVEREVDVPPGARVRGVLPLARLLPMPRLRVAGDEAAVVHVDGEVAAVLPWEGEVEPGERRLVVEGNGLHRWEGTVLARRGETVEVQVHLGRTASGPDPAWIWVSAGVAAAAAAVALGFGAASLDANGEFETSASSIQASSYGSAEELEALQDRGRSAASDARDWALAADVGWGIAAGGALAALVLALLHDAGEGNPTVTFSTGGEIALAVGWAW